MRGYSPHFISKPTFCNKTNLRRRLWNFSRPSRFVLYDPVFGINKADYSTNFFFQDFFTTKKGNCYSVFVYKIICLQLCQVSTEMKFRKNFAQQKTKSIWFCFWRNVCFTTIKCIEHEINDILAKNNF